MSGQYLHLTWYWVHFLFNRKLFQGKLFYLFIHKNEKVLSNIPLQARMESILHAKMDGSFTLFPWKFNVTVIPKEWEKKLCQHVFWLVFTPSRTLQRALNKFWATLDNHFKLGAEKCLVSSLYLSHFMVKISANQEIWCPSEKPERKHSALECFHRAHPKHHGTETCYRSS